jgi:hypothetical protein
MFCSGFTGSLTIPNSVTDIDDYAFYGCSSFNGTLTIPDSVTSIGNFVFEYCSGFNTINVSDWTTIPTIGNYAFLYFNTEGGIVLVPANYDDLGITISTFKGLPSTWQLSPV